jgi:hypothetical protein
MKSSWCGTTTRLAIPVTSRRRGSRGSSRPMIQPCERSSFDPPAARSAFPDVTLHPPSPRHRPLMRLGVAGHSISAHSGTQESGPGIRDNSRCGGTRIRRRIECRTTHRHEIRARGRSRTLSTSTPKRCPLSLEYRPERHFAGMYPPRKCRLS